MNDIEKFLEKAISCIEEDPDGKKVINGGENIRKFNLSMEIIFNSYPGISDILKCHKISRMTVEKDIRNILYSIKDSKNVKDDFKNGINELKKKYGQQSCKKYIVGFPLNIKFPSQEVPNEFKILNKKIENIDIGEWRNKFVSPIKKKSNNFDIYARGVPNKIYSIINFSYWKFKMDSLDRFYVIKVLEYLLELFLGEINYSLNFQRRKESFSVVPNNRISDIRTPFVYIVSGDDNISYFSNEDITKRKKVSINGFKKERFKLYDELPNLNNENTIDNLIIKAFRAYQSGITNLNLKKSFLDFWRGMEALTLKEDNEKSGLVIERISSIYRHSYPDISKNIIKKLVNKRNDLVHEGIDCNISDTDRQFSKSMLEVLINFFISFKDEFDYEDFKYILINGRKKITELTDLKMKYKRKIELIEKMIDWKENYK